MARNKLTPDDRAQIVAQYRQPGITVAMLANQFGVSSSTASRVLKEDIPADEYKALVKQKRASRQSGQQATDTQPSLLDSLPSKEAEQAQMTNGDPPVSDSIEPSAPVEQPDSIEPSAASVELPEASASESLQEPMNTGGEELYIADDADYEELDATAEQLEAELFGDSDDDEEDEEFPLASFEDEDEDDEYDEGEEEEDEEYDEDEDDSPAEEDAETSRTAPWNEQPSQVEVVGPPPAWYSSVQPSPGFIPTAPQAPIDILELEALEYPNQCFAVVDRFQELTTCPLHEFKHLGDIPQDLAEAKTLPLFDSHRIARRFSDRFRHRGRHKHRVIAFPGYFLSVTRDQLQEKGITHLLVDNQVYEL